MWVRATLRVWLPILTVLLIGTGSAAAAERTSPRVSPAPVVVHGVERSADAVRGYWTPRRMREAQPAPPPKVPAELREELEGPSDDRVEQSSDGGVETRSHGTVSRSEVTDTTAFPNRTHGRVFFSFEGGDFACSGTAVTAANESLVVTAGHCVHEGGPGGAFATNWVFVPGYREGEAPFGAWPAAALGTTAGWESGADAAHDVGIAVVGTSSNRGEGSLEDMVGARGIAFNRPREQTYHAYGYPAVPSLGVPPTLFDGERLYVCHSPYGGADSPGDPAPMRITCDQTEGSSGGGWVVDGGIVQSVISYGYLNEPDHLYGPYFGSAAANLYEVGQRGSAPDGDAGPAPTPVSMPRCLGQAATHVGTDGADVMVGTRAADVFVGFAGNDRIDGRGGEDRVCAGTGKDRVSGGGGRDRMSGGGGGDRLRGGKGRDLLRGGKGRDRLAGGVGKDKLAGGKGRDILNGGKGRDACIGGAGKDRARNCERIRGVP